MNFFRGSLLALVFGICLVNGQRCLKEIDNFGELTWSVEGDSITINASVNVTGVWVGFGFGDAMVGSDSVAALDGDVVRLFIKGKTPQDVVQLPPKTVANITAISTTRNQEINGQTRFGYSRPLAAVTAKSKEVVFGENSIVWAIGSGPELGIHTTENRGIDSITVNENNCPEIPSPDEEVVAQDSVEEEVVDEEVAKEEEAAEEEVMEEAPAERVVPAPAIPAIPLPTPGPPTIPPAPPVAVPSLEPPNEWTISRGGSTCWDNDQVECATCVQPGVVGCQCGTRAAEYCVQCGDALACDALAESQEEPVTDTLTMRPTLPPTRRPALPPIRQPTLPPTRRPTLFRTRRPTLPSTLAPAVAGPSAAPAPEEEDDTEEEADTEEEPQEPTLTEMPEETSPGTALPTTTLTEAPVETDEPVTETPVDTEEPTTPPACDDCCEVTGSSCVCCDEGEICAADGTGCTVEGDDTDEESCPALQQCEGATGLGGCCPEDWICIDNTRCKKKCDAHTAPDGCFGSRQECCEENEYCDDMGVCSLCSSCWLSGNTFDGGDCPCEAECTGHGDCAENQFCQSPGGCSDCSNGCNDALSVDGDCEMCSAVEEETRQQSCARGQACPEGQYCGGSFCKPCAACRGGDCPECEAPEVPYPSGPLPPTPLPMHVPVPVPEPSEQPVPHPVPVPVPGPSDLVPAPVPGPGAPTPGIPAPDAPAPGGVPVPSPLVPVPGPVTEEESSPPVSLPVISDVSVEFYKGGAIISWELEDPESKKLLSRVQKFFSRRRTQGRVVQLLQNSDEEESCFDQGKDYWIVIRMTEFRKNKENIEFREDCDGDNTYDWTGLDDDLEYTFDVAVTNEPGDYENLEFVESGDRGKPVSGGGGESGCNTDCKIAVGILVPIFALCIIGALVYFLWWKPKQEEDDEPERRERRQGAEVPEVGPVSTALVMRDSDSDRSATPPEAHARRGEVEMAGPEFDDDSDDHTPDVR